MFFFSCVNYIDSIKKVRFEACLLDGRHTQSRLSITEARQSGLPPLNLFSVKFFFKCSLLTYCLCEELVHASWLVYYSVLSAKRLTRPAN